MRYLGFIFVFLVLATINTLGVVVAQPTSQVPAATYDDRLRFDYSDWDSLLLETVFVNGLSDRIPARRPRPEMGTFAVRGNKSKTRLEANRVFYHAISDGGKDYVRQVRLALQSLPDQVPLAKFHPDERLAFWLNLRNLTVFEAILDEYPIGRLERFLKKLSKDKRITVEGKAMSIGDIEAHVKANWKSPYVMYGFYNGTIGGPNLRIRAFTRKNVWEYLERNAREFIESLRGVQFDDNVAKVSTLYKNHADLFPNFNADLRAHMLEAANPDMADRIRQTDTIKPTVEDWYLADLYSGTYGTGSAAMVGPAALLTAFGDSIDAGHSGNVSLRTPGPGEEMVPLGDTMGILSRGMNNLALQGHPLRVQELLERWYMRHADSRHGTVSIDEVENSDRRVITPTDQKEDENEPND